MGRIILAIVGAALGIVVFWGLFLLPPIWRSLEINPRDAYYDFGPFEVGLWFMFTTIGGLLGLIVGLRVGSRLSKHGGKTGEELKAEGTKFHTMNYWRIIRVRFVTILLVFLLTAVTTTVVSFLLPKTYMSMSRITVEKDTSDIAPLNGIQSGATAFDSYFIQTELEVIQSQKVLDKVVSKCRLTNVWKRLNGGKSLTPREARKILKKAIDIRQFRNTSIIELRAYDRIPTKAQEIAQALAEEYQTHRTDAQKKRVEIIDDAERPVQAVRPNIPLNITLGVVAGLILGVGLAFLIEYLDQLPKRFKEKQTPPQTRR
jgi:capsular polysaccharide biosynthesis protein